MQSNLDSQVRWDIYQKHVWSTIQKQVATRPELLIREQLWQLIANTSLSQVAWKIKYIGESLGKLRIL